MKKFVGSILAAGMVASGCVVDVVFEPIGGDVRVDGAWTINGGTANAGSCGAAGIATVQLFVCDAVDGDCYGGAEINAPCENGAFLTGPILKPDFYAYYWAALDAGGSEIGVSAWQTATVGSGGTLVADADFVMAMPGEVTMNASWTINGLNAEAGSCGVVGVQTIRLEITDSVGVFRQFDMDCSIGGFDSRVETGAPTLPEGDFFTQWYAIDETGGVLSQTDAPLALVTTGQTHVTLASPDFIFDLINSLDVAFTYDIGDGTYGDCTTAAINGTWGYILSSSGGETIAMEFGLACQNGILFEDVASDVYTLDINADALAPDSTKWGALCDGLDVLRGLEAYDCQVPIVP